TYLTDPTCLLPFVLVSLFNMPSGLAHLHTFPTRRSSDLARGLDDDRCARLAEHRAEILGRQRPLTEVGVAVGAGVEGVAAVVGVDEVDPPGHRADPLDESGELLAAGVEVAGVEAEPDLRAAVGREHRGPQLLEALHAAGHRAVAARRVLDEHGDLGIEPCDALAPVVEPDGRV